MRQTQPFFDAFTRLWFTVVEDARHVARLKHETRLTMEHAELLRAHLERARDLITTAARLYESEDRIAPDPGGAKLVDALREVELMQRWVAEHRPLLARRRPLELESGLVWADVLRRDFAMAQGARRVVALAFEASRALPDSADEFEERLKKAERRPRKR